MAQSKGLARRTRMLQVLCKLLRDVQLERTLAWAGVPRETDPPPACFEWSRHSYRHVERERSFGFPAARVAAGPSRDGQRSRHAILKMHA
jgi:hypothetical protein